ncbi:MAG: hypothetical protein ACREOK_16290 [Gemmatimonadaceae bacterium]
MRAIHVGLGAVLFTAACGGGDRSDRATTDTATAGGAVASGAPDVRVTTVTGGGDVIQSLPGPSALADSARPIVQRASGEQREMLEMMGRNGPFSDKAAKISGEFRGTFWDGGRTGDSVNAEATFRTQDGAQWRAVIDRVAPEDAPMEPHWGGVGTDMTYHGSSGLGVPFVPMVRTAVSYYGMSKLYRNDALVDSSAMTHVMLSTQTQGRARGEDYAYKCWDCTQGPIEQLHLMLMPPKGEMYQVPGGIIHVMWQKSEGSTTGAPRQ